MEHGGSCNAITTTTITLKAKPHSNPDPKDKPVSDPFLIKKENQKPTTRGDQAAKYKECQKNHAALTGGHVVDGCCEFMPGGEEGTQGALKCAACNCHRSFHRKEVYGHRNSTREELISTAVYKAIQPRGVYPTSEIGRRASSSSEDMKKILNQNTDGKDSMRKKKRVRTKISEEQKKKMKEFAERLGWSMQKKDEEEIDKFCRTVNLRRQVFKVWMHNNKQAMKRNGNLNL
ncbi:Zinc-finger homeodomain protein 7 [Raphanus sativus]|uniref:Zinc-finger homeodomain protein 7 n=1 Tax=Raphanus sativus TaxID=3726 RepID=A0A6J0N8G2_RAPSA|nr:zinc-finger homeodomain protein 7 [Raphanus sativus]XP_018480794.2 zinc-finger homeodomain protein 7 [Raphanus sativus]KAJ4872636.1 Zinc-finger homeodomain protein 7 [Raphanus sativus]